MASENTMMMSVEELTGIPCRIEFVKIKKNGKGVFVKEMSGQERDEFETDVFADEKKDTKLFRAKIVQKTVCDELGNLIFKNTKEDLAKLNNMPSKVLDKIMKAAQELNKISKEDKQELLRD